MPTNFTDILRKDKVDVLKKQIYVKGSDKKVFDFKELEVLIPNSNENYTMFDPFSNEEKKGLRFVHVTDDRAAWFWWNPNHTCILKRLFIFKNGNVQVYIIK